MKVNVFCCCIQQAVGKWEISISTPRRQKKNANLMMKPSEVDVLFGVGVLCSPISSNKTLPGIFQNCFAVFKRVLQVLSCCGGGWEILGSFDATDWQSSLADVNLHVSDR